MRDTSNVYLTPGRVAILIDGGFFLKRLNALCKPEERNQPDYIVKMIRVLCSEHAKRLEQPIYRVFFYDCPPFERGIHNPLTGKFIKFGESEQYRFKVELFEKLKEMRKMALRLGRINLDSTCSWQIKASKVKELLSGKTSISQLDPDADIIPNIRQKQVDIKIGVDIASMVLKKQVSSIVLVAGDGDFVPASKLARREGVDFILDPMWARVNPDLKEHVDGINMVLFKQQIRAKSE